MENISQFDLNAALRLWLETLAQSPGFRNENVAELESHVRDSIGQLQSHGLSEEESFFIATRRVGAVEKIGPEFAKVNRDPWNLLSHALVLAFFSAGCWFLWALLMVARMAGFASGGRPLPAFTIFMLGLKSYLIAPPLLALAYCVITLIRRSGARAPWIGFFAVCAGSLILLAFPTIVALVLPIISALNQLSGH